MNDSDPSFVSMTFRGKSLGAWVSRRLEIEKIWCPQGVQGKRIFLTMLRGLQTTSNIALSDTVMSDEQEITIHIKGEIRSHLSRCSISQMCFRKGRAI